MSQKPRAAMKPADADPRPVAEPVETIAESVTAAAEAAVEVMAVTAEAVGKATTAAAETVTTISVGSAPASAAIETTKPATKPGMEKKNTDNVAAHHNCRWLSESASIRRRVKNRRCHRQPSSVAFAEAIHSGPSN